MPFADGAIEVPFNQCKLARFTLDGAPFENVTAGPNNIWGLVTARDGETYLQEANDQADLTGKFTVYTAFLRSDGAVSAVGRQTQEFRFPADSLEKRKAVMVKLDVTVDARVDAISVGVMDEASSATGFVLVKLGTEAPKTGSAR